MRIRAARPQDRERLYEIWHEAVLATHHFLSEEDRAFFDFERYGGFVQSARTLKPTWDLEQEYMLGRIPKAFCESGDPKRLVPLVWEPDDYMVAVTGDLMRNSIYIFAHNGVLGYPTGKEIRLPKDWSALLERASRAA